MTPEDHLTELGHIDPPDPAVLAAARETLWAAVAEDMLSAAPAPPHPQTANPARQAPRPHHAAPPHQTPEPPAPPPRHADPGV